MVAAIAETLTMKTHLGILGFVASCTQYNYLKLVVNAT